MRVFCIHCSSDDDSRCFKISTSFQLLLTAQFDQQPKYAFVSSVSLPSLPHCIRPHHQHVDRGCCKLCSVDGTPENHPVSAVTPSSTPIQCQHRVTRIGLQLRRRHFQTRRVCHAVLFHSLLLSMLILRVRCRHQVPHTADWRRERRVG